MNQATLTILILAFVILLYATEKLPLVLTAMLSMLAVYFTGVLSFADAFSGFANNATLMVLGMSIFGDAFLETGLIEKAVKGLRHLFLRGGDFSEKSFLLIGGVLIAAMSIFLNPMLTTTVFMYIVDTLSREPGSQITRKNTYLPLGAAAIYGCLCTSISSTTVIVASGLMADSAVGRGFHFFEPAILGLPSLLVYLLFFGTVGHKLEGRWFTFDDIPSEETAGLQVAGAGRSPAKMYITLVILVVCIFLFIFSSFALGAVAFAGGAALMLTKCVDAGKALKNARWSTVVMVACSLGFAKGVDVSGAGEVIANFMIRLCGPLAGTGFGICVIAFIVSTLLSNTMNNSSTVAILIPIFVVVAEVAGAPLVPVFLAVTIGTSLVTATPICTASITLTTSAGYRFVDYLRIGGLLNLLTVLVSALVLYIVYFA